MNFTKVSGPVREMLGIQSDASLDAANIEDSSSIHLTGWDETKRKELQATIAARKPFLDFVFHRNNSDGSQRRFQVSGEPMFDEHCRFIGYRGIGVELTGKYNLENGVS
jgi:hypothetical protein